MKQKYTNKLSLRKVILSAMVAAPLATLPTPMWALPSTASSNVTSSSSSTTFTTVGTTLNITTPDRTVLKWVAFGDGGANAIGASDAIIYNLPSSSSSVLNMVTGGTSTLIDGSLTSNGQILLLNPNGITVSSTGKITATGVTLSTRPETEFFYQANGALALNGAPLNAGDISVAGNIAVGSSGNVLLAGQNVAVTGNIDAGTLTINAAKASDAGAEIGNVSIGGAASIVVGNTTASTPYGSLVVNTTGGTIDFAPAAATSVTIGGGSATLTTGNGTITESGAGSVVVGSGANGTLNINAGTGAVTLGAINPAAGKTLTVNVNSAGATTLASGNDKLTVAATTTGALSVTAASDLTLNASNVGGALSLTSSTGSVASGGTTTVKSGSAITLSAAGAGKSITFAGTGNLTFGTITTAADGSVTLSSTGDIPVPAVTAKNLTVTTSGGSITQTGGLTLTGTGKFDSGNATTLTGTNSIATIVLKNAPQGGNVTDSTGFTIGSGTAATGDVTLTGGGAVAFGTASGDTIAFGNVSLTTTGAVTQVSDNTTVTGNLTIAAGANAVTLAGSKGTGVGLKNNYGQVNITGSSAEVFAQNALNLGTINVGAGKLVAYSGNSVTNTGILTTGPVIVGAGTASSPGAIALNYVDTNGNSNQIGGAITILDDINLLGGNATTPVAAVSGNMLASNVTVENSAPITGFTLGTNIYGTMSSAPVSLTTTGANALTANTLNTTGVVSLTTTTGAITATDAGNTFTNLVLTSKGGAATVSTTGDLTVNAALSGTTGNTHPNAAVSITAGGNATLGTITSVYDTATLAVTGKSVSDSVSGLSIYGPVSFTGANGVTITKAGHNFGGITVDTHSNNGNVTLVEGGTMKIVSINAAKGAVTLTSSNQSVIQTGSITSSGTATFNASQGTVVLDTVANPLTGNVSLTAVGNSTLKSSGALKLGTVTVTNGTFSATASGGGNDLTQSGPVNVYGDTTLASGGNVTLTNAGNAFGGLIVGGTNVSLTENGTLNVKSIQTAGKVALTSVNGDIIDTTDSNVGNNGISNGAAAVGAATFTASNGSVTLDNTANNFSTVSFTTAGNATIIQPTGATGTFALGASTVGGALTVTDQVASAGISQTGALNVAGNATFNTNNGALNLNNSANSFGPVRFVVGQASTLTENSTFNLNSGSVATAPVVINTNGNFITSGTGGSSFTSDLTINAIGTIIPSSGSLLVTGTFTVFSNNTKDLSALSQSGNLAGKAPVNQGTGTYVPPSP